MFAEGERDMCLDFTSILESREIAQVKGSLKMTRMFCHKCPTSSEAIRQDLPAPLRIHGQGHSERAAEDSSDHFSLDSTSEEVNLVRMNTVDKTR